MQQQIEEYRKWLEEQVVFWQGLGKETDHGKNNYELAMTNLNKFASLFPLPSVAKSDAISVEDAPPFPKGAIIFIENNSGSGSSAIHGKYAKVIGDDIAEWDNINGLGMYEHGFNVELLEIGYLAHERRWRVPMNGKYNLISNL